MEETLYCRVLCDHLNKTYVSRKERKLNFLFVFGVIPKILNKITQLSIIIKDYSFNIFGVILTIHRNLMSIV